MPARELKGQTLQSLYIKANTGIKKEKKKIIIKRRPQFRVCCRCLARCAQVVNYVFVFFYLNGFAAMLDYIIIY